jgi:hypothetical protein
MMKIPYKLFLYFLGILAFWPGFVLAQSPPTPANPATIKAVAAQYAATFTNISADSLAVRKNLDYLGEAFALSVMKGTGRSPSGSLRAECREFIFAMMEGIFAIERILENSDEYANFAASRLTDNEARLLLKTVEGNARLTTKYAEKREIETLVFLGWSGDGFNAYFRSAMINAKHWQRGEYAFETAQLFPYQVALVQKLYARFDAEERKIFDLSNDELRLIVKGQTIWTNYRKSLPRDMKPFAIVTDKLDKLFPMLVKKYAS